MVRPLVAALAGLVVGAVVTVAIQGGATPAPDGRAPTSPAAMPSPTFLAWVPGGLPAGFDDRVRALDETGPVTTVAEDHAWLERSWNTSGEIVDRTREPYRLPIDTIAVDVASFGAFLSDHDRALATPIASGQGVLSATSASLRGLGPGAELRFAGGRTVQVAAVLPDAAIGGAELMVSRDTGSAIGVRSDRYLLLRSAVGHRMRSGTLRPLLRSLLTDRPGAIDRVQVRTASETPLLRPGDAVLSTARTKTLFGEFAARPEPGRPGYLDLDPRWVGEHLVTTRLPLLGRVTCHRSIVDALRGAMRTLRERGLASTIETYDGCFAPRLINRDPSAMLSHHSWGIAVDLNIARNYYGEPPDQDPRLVRVMERWGFAWGGRFIVPDGNHFEYHREPAPPATPTPAPEPVEEAAEGPAALETVAIEPPPYFLAWTPGGLPAGFRERVGGLEGLAETVVFAGDTAWLTRSLDADGGVVDDPPAPFEHPIDAFAVDPSEVASFLPKSVRGRVVGALERGTAVIGTRGATIRDLGVGGTLEFGRRSVRVGAIVPEELIGWAEMVVARDVGADLGIVDDRHLWAYLARPADGERRRDLVTFRRIVRRLVPVSEPMRVEEPGSSPYMRVANGVNPPIVLKQAFGEFAAAPDPSDPAFFTLSPAWVEANLVTRTVPLLGELTCHRAFMGDLVRAMDEVRRRGLGDQIHSTAGCFNARTVARSPTNPPSFHAYGAAVDINAPQNAFGAEPTMDPRVVTIFERLGFNWGGDFVIPDGMHFEYGGGPLRANEPA